MSTEPAKPSSSRRRQNSRGPRGPPRKPAETSTPAPAAESVVVAEKAVRPPRPPRVETAPIPEESVGKSFVGRISDVIRAGAPVPRPAFGFINMGDNVEPLESVPRIYFKKSDFTDDKHYFPRRGYQVEFTVNKNDEGRFFANNIRLTEAGKIEADENKRKADENKAAKAAAAAAATPAAKTPASTKPSKSEDATDGAAKKKPAAAAKKSVKNETVVQLQVTLEGSQATHTVDVKVGGALGALKKEIIKLFEATGDFKINHVTAENPAGTYLTVAILKSLKNGDHIHFSKVEPATTTTA